MIDRLYNAFTLFLSLLVEAIPFLLFGVLLSSILLLTIDEQKLIKKLPNNPLLGAMVGSSIGFLFPVCECGNVPVARRLLLKGVSPGVAIAFLLAAPTINPVVIWSTWVAFGEQPQIVILRIVFSLFIATIIGCIFSIEKDASNLLQSQIAKRLDIFLSTKKVPEKYSPIETKVPALMRSGTYLLNSSSTTPVLDLSLLEENKKTLGLPNIKNKWQQLLENVFQELQELGGMLVIGSAIASCIQVFIPREIIFNLGQDNITSIVAMMLLAAIVSICSTVDSFFALSFASTFTSASLLSFLVFGPTIDIKAIGLMLSVFKPKVIFYIFILVAQLTFILTLLYSYLF